jgi:hypothetical protein
MLRRVRWGRWILVLLALVAVVVILWHYGLTKGSAIATIGAFVVALFVVVQPRLGLRDKQVKRQVGTAQERQAPENEQTATVEPGNQLAEQATPLTAPERPGVATAVAHGAGTATKADVEQVLLHFSDIGDPDFRLQLLQAMGEYLELNGSFPVAYSALAQDHVFAIVRAIWTFHDPQKARAALISAAERLRPYEAATAQLRELL